MMHRRVLTGGKDRFEKRWNAKVTGDDTEECQNQQRGRHRLGGFVDMVCVMGVDMGLTPEGHKHQSEAVERGQESGEQACDRQDPTKIACRPGRGQDLVFAEKPGRQRESCERQ